MMCKGGNLLRFVLFQMFMVGALCCTCVYKHPQQHYCDNEFVLKVRVKESLDLKVGSGFSVKITRVFKGDLQTLTVTNSSIVDLVMPPACHVDMMKSGDRYFIFGESRNGQLYTDICNGNQLWRYSSKFFRRGLAKFYKSGCNCSNEIGNFSRDKKCHWNFSFLQKHGDKCAWTFTKYMRECLSGNVRDGSS